MHLASHQRRNVVTAARAEISAFLTLQDLVRSMLARNLQQLLALGSREILSIDTRILDLVHM